MKFPLFGKEEDDNPAPADEQYAELPEDSAVMRMRVMVEKLDGLPSVDKIMRKVRDGNIVIASIRDMKEANTEELKHCISRMKTACMNINGDIAGAGEEWIIITPSSAGIYREAVLSSDAKSDSQ
ncbi:MAG: cell division protein SepF [Candidatus Aenigmarchaeota archaeon]|nr:cell division protein SepF [Candidatus Aenigmarchaeota archaeon]